MTADLALVIADNKIAENAGWNDDLLRQELQALDGEEFDLDPTVSLGGGCHRIVHPWDDRTSG